MYGAQMRNARKGYLEVTSAVDDSPDETFCGIPESQADAVDSYLSTEKQTCHYDGVKQLYIFVWQCYGRTISSRLVFIFIDWQQTYLVLATL